MTKYKRRDKRGKFTKKVKGIIAVCVVAAAFLLSVLITNAFIPIKYFTAYCVKGNGNTSGIMRVSFIDVGFGDSVLIELPDGKTALIDGGDGGYSHQLHLLKFLNSRSVDTIDYLICTSVKKEHCGGLDEILKCKRVENAYVPYCLNTRITSEYHAFITRLEKQDIPVTYACMGEGVFGEGADNGSYFLTFLSPSDYRNPLGAYAELNKSPTAANIENASAVVWLSYGETAFAFMSDIRADGLKSIMSDYANCVNLGVAYCPVGDYSVRLEDCKVVTAPAHGGANNTYAQWYDFINPEQAVISVGENFAGYPSDKAFFDICLHCSPLVTSEKGDITFTVDANGYTVN